MITENAEVIEVDTDRINVLVRGSSGCGACTEKSGCGNGLLDRWLNPPRSMWIESDPELCAEVSPGDQVLVALEEGTFVKSALGLYLIPILTFLLGAGLAHQFLSNFGDASAVIGGFLGLALGSGLIRFLATLSSHSDKFAPHILIK